MFMGWQSNFQGPLNSSQVIFRQVILTPGPPGSALTLKNGVSAKSISSEAFGAGGSVAPFLIWNNEVNKLLGAEY